jgi:hypothetical protein
MSWRCALALGLCLLSCDARAAAERVTRFAIVIGNNRPEDRNRAVLRYADDDAVATHRLLRQAGVHSVLLTRLDGDTRRLNPSLVPDGPPRWSSLERALSETSARIRASGGETELLLFYSGHGDVALGEGYVVLEERRLTRSLLHRKILARLPSTRNHVVVDACKSYYLAFERGPGGRRRAYHRSFAGRSRRSTRSKTGFILSTSSGRDSHEWERFQAGVFSHVVRSALRGGGDADRDGRVSYAELGAFLRTASAQIPNPRFRPDFVVRPPGYPGAGALDQTVLAWRRGGDTLALDLPSAGHLFLENARGERVLDVHPASDQVLALRLPAERPLFVRRADGRAEYPITSAGGARLSRLGAARLQVARRGAIHLAFERLFAAPFSRNDVTAFSAWHRRQQRRLAHAGPEWHPCPEDELGHRAGPPPRAVVIERSRRIGHELSLGVGALPADYYTTGLLMTGGYTWHAGDLLALEARFSYARSFKKDLREKLENNFGIPEARFAEVRHYAELGLLIKPLYGDLDLFGGGITIPLELHFSASAVVALLDGGRKTEEHPAGQPEHVGFGGAPGVGLRCFVSRHLSVRLELRQLLLDAAGRFHHPFSVALSLGLATERDR